MLLIIVRNTEKTYFNNKSIYNVFNVILINLFNEHLFSVLNLNLKIPIDHKRLKVSVFDVYVMYNWMFQPQYMVIFHIFKMKQNKVNILIPIR